MNNNIDNQNHKSNNNSGFKNKINLILGGSLLVSGTCIGGGMLGLPVSSAALGFYPTLATFLVVWLVMTISALYMLEVSFYVKGETNLVGMAGKTLGKTGRNLAWFFYIAFLYSVMASYTSGGATLLASMLNFKITSTADLITIATVFVIVFGGVVYLGAKSVDYCNRILMLGLIIAYIALIIFVKGDSVTLTQNSFGSFKYVFFALPLMVTSFGYHLLIPTLKYYLKENIFALRIAIVLGGLIPLIIYSFWEYEIFSLIPIWGDDGLVSILNTQQNPAELIIAKAGSGVNKNVGIFMTSFSFFALVSSFIGVGLGILDFLADGLKIQKTKASSKIILAIFTFLPPALFTILVPGGFMLALGYAGIFATILLIIYPTIMAWYGRYSRNGIIPVYKVFGGRIMLAIVILFGFLIIVAEVLQKFNFLPVPKV